MLDQIHDISLQNQELPYIRSNDLLSDSKQIIETARDLAYKAINVALVRSNWLLGKRIAEEELSNSGRAEYGKQVIATLASDLTALYGNSLDVSNLYKFVAFYKAFPNLDSLRLKSGNLLTWTHLRAEIESQKQIISERHGIAVASSAVPAARTI